jgi:NADH-quinone oxidoreductase subunit J
MRSSRHKNMNGWERPGIILSATRKTLQWTKSLKKKEKGSKAILSFILFIVISLIMVFSAIMVISAKNIVHSAFYLAVTLLCTAIFFILLRAQYLAAVQILVYIGAVVVLILFALMLTRTVVGQNTNISSKQTVFAAIVSLILFAALSIVFNITEVAASADVSQINIISIKDFSGILFSKYALPFEVASVLLLAALVGSVVLAVRDRQDDKEIKEGDNKKN